MSFDSNIILGPLLLGTWANSALYIVEAIQVAYYYRHFKHDNWMLKMLVASAVVLDSVSMIANYASVYLYTILHWGDLATKNKFITLTLFLFITVETGGIFASGLSIAIYPGFKDREKIFIPATIWLITEAVADVSIALALVWEFRKVKSSFKETRSLVNRLAAQTIQTGTAGATIALAALVAYLVNNESNVCAGIAYPLGRVYCITMLANLNRRKPENTWSGKGTSSGGIHETRGERGKQERSEGGDEYGGIHVHRTAVVHIDNSQEFSRGSFKTNPGKGNPDDSPAGEIEMTVNDSASYSSKKKQDLYAP
ncbi:hypothetical protein B0H19DRAFT_1385104 [Mycena capillaripes]|nr:hypothetical protein B0H19DRAFT_1385104 [Mycena capillaripes]